MALVSKMNICGRSILITLWPTVATLTFCCPTKALPLTDYLGYEGQPNQCIGRLMTAPYLPQTLDSSYRTNLMVNDVRHSLQLPFQFTSPWANLRYFRYLQALGSSRDKKQNHCPTHRNNVLSKQTNDPFMRVYGYVRLCLIKIFVHMLT